LTAKQKQDPTLRKSVAAYWRTQMKSEHLSGIAPVIGRPQDGRAASCCIGESMKKLVVALIGAALAAAAGFAVGHSGGTDANGCHKNHNTGEYHCHKPK
jgi:hypothetical protein